MSSCSPQEELTVVPLWDGAITISVPKTFNSISHMVNAPDNQELLSDPDTRTSIILELLDLAPASSAAALELHIADVSPDTPAYILPAAPLDGGHYPAFAALVRQRPTGGRGEHDGDTAVAYGLVRYEAREADVLVSVVVKVDGQWDGRVEGHVGRGVRMRDEVLRTLEVKNPGLFG